jgi:WXXGXW repeat (2 copies)
MPRASARWVGVFQAPDLQAWIGGRKASDPNIRGEVHAMSGYRRILGATLVLGMVAASPVKARAEDGAEVLAQGPIHEAFAQPVLYEPKPGAVIVKPPPAAINELPPDQKPEGANVQWIPGYWSWDDDRNDYIWVSGVWRAIPPGRQWNPGYWNQLSSGFRWVPGYWSAADVAQAQYLPTGPPASLEQGPSSPAPAATAVWAPGSWLWRSNQYAWQPGFWVNAQPNWVWTPGQYSATPNGYLYNQGFWDYPLATRGTMFAPVYFNQPIYNQPGYVYSPGIGLLAGGLTASLFIRPSYGSYYFGNYYGANNFQRGIYPFYSFHQSRYGYDPIYANAVSFHSRTDPQWTQNLHASYVYRRDHIEARPPATYAESVRLASRPVSGGNPAIAPLNLVRPINQIAAGNVGANPNGAKFEAQAMHYKQIDQAQRQQIAKQATEIHQYRDERMNREVQAAKAAPAASREAPRQVNVPRSPVVGREAVSSVPAHPAHPAVDQAAKPPAANAASIRHEPAPHIQPPPHQQAPHPQPAARPGGGEGARKK